MQMRIERAGRVVSEQGRRKVAGQPVILRAMFPDASCRKRLKFVEA
jgi:hypothetical protein